MFIFQDEDILDEGFRLKIIKEIEGAENLKRKSLALKRYEMFRDKTLDHVMKRLEDQGFNRDTLQQMRARGSNISILKKITKKKSRAYVAGVDRSVVDEQGQVNADATKNLHVLANKLKVTQQFRKADEYRELSRNALLYCHPIPAGKVATPDGMMNKWDMNTRVLHSHQFDAIPLAHNREEAGCIILSDYPAGLYQLSNDRGAQGYRGGVEGSTGGDGINQLIANSREDAGANPGKKKIYIWWTATYHFTTDGDGKIIPGQQRPDNMNLIKAMPFVHLAKDQDGEFWGQGGDDLSEGNILVNLLLTDFAGILSAQGWGQPVVVGNFDKEQKDEIETGPHNLIRLYQKPGQPTPSFDLVSTDPHSEAWLKLVEVYVALLLTTNNLSPRNISGKLDANSVASGIAKMIDESESTEDITESQGYYADAEERFWEIVYAWLDVLRPTERLVEYLAKIPSPPPGSKVNTRFRKQGSVMSESERLDLLKKRKDIGLTLFGSLIKMDNPDLSDEEAKKLLQDVLAERVMIRNEDPSLLNQAPPQAAQPMVDNQDGSQDGEDDPNEDPADV